MRSPVAHLRQLLDILTQSIDAIETIAIDKGLCYPSLDAPLSPHDPAESLVSDPLAAKMATLGAAAAAQLLASLKTSDMVLFDRLSAFHVSSALRVAAEASITELLRESPGTLHVNEIAQMTRTDPKVMSRIMRLLCTHFVFREVEPDVFANNRISSLMDTGKPSEDLLKLMRKRWEGVAAGANVSDVQAEKYRHPLGMCSIIEHCSDEGMKSSAHLSEYVLGDHSRVPFQHAFNDEGFFEFMDAPGREGYLARSQAAYEGSTKLEPETAILTGFDWRALPAESLVVDVGCGTGMLSLRITEHAPHLRIIMEDRAAAIDHVILPRWNADPTTKGYLDSGRVALQVHDFFEPQPEVITGKPDVFLLRYIIHDWPDEQVLVILQHLHAAAPSEGRLLIIDNIVPYACPPPDVEREIEGSNLSLPPAPLLANLGMANTIVYFADMMMMNILGAQERTLGQFIDLFARGGWKLAKIHSPPGSRLKQMECVKI